MSILSLNMLPQQRVHIKWNAGIFMIFQMRITQHIRLNLKVIEGTARFVVIKIITSTF